MKSTNKKETAGTAMPKPSEVPPKQTSGDSKFDAAIDQMLKKPIRLAPTK